MNDRGLFRTFCHISDYGTGGYANLHRLIATSSPLVLWSPSSQLLQAPECRVTPEAFVRFVEQGTIRIIGRQNWLLDKNFRNGHHWSGAYWDSTVDDAIRSIALDDDYLPLNQRRVAVSPDEQGLARAEEHVEQFPEVIASLQAAMEHGAAELPAGVVGHASRYAGDPRELAINILRPAYNHLDAIALSGTRAPFMLDRKESRFHELLASLNGPSPETFPRHRDEAQVLTELTVQVLDLMRHLDGLRDDRTSLEGFVNGEGHALLTRWLCAICDDVRTLPPGSAESVVVDRFRDEFERGTVRTGWRDLTVNFEGALGGVGLTSAALETLVQQVSVFTAIGFAAGGVQLARLLLQRLGHAKATYEGASQWPFLYTFGKPASGKRHERLGNLLDGLA